LGAKKSPGLPGDTYVDFRSISIGFQQKHSRLLAKEVIKIKPVCLCDCHVSKLMIPFKEKNYCHIFFDHFSQIQKWVFRLTNNRWPYPDYKYKRPPSREALRLLASQCLSYFLVVSALCVVSGAILLDVSIIAGALVSTGATVVVSLVSELLPLLLHAAKAVTIIAIANNFFICRILYC